MKKDNKTKWLVLWSRPQDDSWLYYIPNKLFSTKKEVTDYIKKNLLNPGDDYKVLSRF